MEGTLLLSKVKNGGTGDYWNVQMRESSMMEEESPSTIPTNSVSEYRGQDNSNTIPFGLAPKQGGQ